mgnify:CR=1 FL=1
MFSFVEVDLNNDVFRRQMNKWLFFSFVKVSFNKVLFFDEDKPRLMTPKEVLGLKPVSGVQIKEMPKFINYQ